jgi:hypothetical protein
VPVRVFFFFVRLFDPLEGLGWALGLEKCEGLFENVLSRETRPLFWASHGAVFSSPNWGRPNYCLAL